MKPIYKKQNLILFLILFPLQLLAKINPIEGSFQYELELTQDFKIHYHSRRLANNLFGDSWCSPIDRKIIIDSSGSPTLYICDELFIQNYKKMNAGQYISVDDPSDKIIKDFSGYTRSFQNTQEKYNNNGRLIESQNGKQKIKIFYDKNNVVQKMQIGKIMYYLSVQNFGQISEMRSKNTHLQFKYESRKLIEYQYDTDIIRFRYANQNLSLIVKNQWSTFILYDSKDRAISYKDNLCEIKVQYLTDFKIKYQKNCDDEKEKTFAFDIDPKTLSLKLSRLSRTPQSILNKEIL